MAETLKLTRTDSPLRRTGPEEKTPRPRRTRKPSPTPRATEETPTQQEETSENPVEPATAPTKNPPPLDEHLGFLSTRVPESLRDRPARMAAKLRERAGIRSQKTLATQEIVTLLVWAYCDPEEPADVEALERLLKTYRARQHTQAATQLTES